MLTLGIFIIAWLGVLLGLGFPTVSDLTFTGLYSNAIGFTFLLLVPLMLLKPNMSKQVQEIISETYSVSTLTGIDCPIKLDQLNRLIREDKLYRDSLLMIWWKL